MTEEECLRLGRPTLRSRDMARCFLDDLAEVDGTCALTASECNRPSSKVLRGNGSVADHHRVLLFTKVRRLMILKAVKN